MKQDNLIRIFTGINISENICSEIKKIQNFLSSTPDKISWVKEQNLHLTLKFLGFVKSKKLQAILQTIQKTANSKKAFDLKLTVINAFPDTCRPKIIWIGPEKTPSSMLDLYNTLELNLEILGFKKEKRKFNTHITIGRVKKINKPKAVEKLIDQVKFVPQTITIKTLTLFKSTLTSQNAVYSVLGKFNLKNT